MRNSMMQKHREKNVEIFRDSEQHGVVIDTMMHCSSPQPNSMPTWPVVFVCPFTWGRQFDSRLCDLDLRLKRSRVRILAVPLWANQCFFVTVRAGTAYRKIWRLVNNFFARIIRFTVHKFQLFWVIFCIIIFFIELWHILILWLAKMPNGGMPVFTLIATGWRYREIFFYKKSTGGRTKFFKILHKNL